MLTAIVVLSLVSLQLVSAQYGKTTTTKKVDEDAPQVQHYDEVYVAGKNGLKAVTAVSGTTDWKEYNLEAKDNTLYAPKGVAICNGAKDEWGRWAYAYVADAGNDEQPAAVYQYNIVRNAENPGEVAIDSATLIYGGDMEGMEDAAPTDVACDEATGGVFIADANKGQIGWQPKAGDAVDAYTTADCADAVSGVQSVTKAGKYLFWSVSNSNNTEANGVYRADASSEVDCASAAEASPYLASTDAAVGVAVHNNRVLYTTGSAAVWQASEKFNGDAWEEPQEWNGGYDQAGYIASAGDRGLLIADTGANALYVSKGDGEANEIATVTDCTGVAYYAGEPWAVEGEAEEEEDSASLATVGLLALGVAAAAQL